MHLHTPGGAGAGWRRSTGARTARHMGQRHLAVDPRPTTTQVAAVNDMLQQLATLDASSVQGAVQAGVSELLAPVPDLPPHFMSQVLAGRIAELAGSMGSMTGADQLVKLVTSQLQSLGEGITAATGARQVLDPVGGALTSLSGVPKDIISPVTGAVKAAAEQLTAFTLPGQEELAPHWGTDAVKELVRRASTSNVGEVLGGAADGAASLLGAATSMEPAAALEAATKQLQRGLQLLGSAPQGFVNNSPFASVLDDLRLVLASLPVPTPGFPSASAPSWLQPGGQAAWPELARLTDRLRLAAEQGTWAGHNLATLALAMAGVALAVGWSARVAPAGLAGAGNGDLGEAEREVGYEYDPERLAEYVARRPVLVMKRAAMVAAEASAFGLALAADFATGRVVANEPARAAQLRFAIERLGPAYVKVAQALSTRVDLLSPAYFEQIQMLQDRVPPFPCEEAKAAMVTAFGKPLDQVFVSLTDKPVAAASLGQVYRATLVPELGGGDVAVKVQRPGVLAAVALDLALIRWLAQAASPKMKSDGVGIIDAWAVRFLHEMDYEREADNAERFAKDMAQLQGITVPVAVRELSTHNVLTSGWVEGERLGESGAPDVRQLCNTLLSAYLIQLLDTGFLHADPHPGNLLRTPDGRIAVLDYGLMTEVTEAQRWALLEYIGHLSTQDWEALALDLQTLGFIPPEVDPRERGLVEPLGRVMSQLVGGGGAAKVNIDKVIGELEELGNNYPIQIPPFFALILRSFSVIEGIALEVDPDYAIVAECFPYLSRRLLADDSPRARALLRDVLYGNKRRLDIERLTRLADGFSAYTTDGLMQQEKTALLTPTSTPSTPVVPSSSSALRRQLGSFGASTSSRSSGTSSPSGTSRRQAAQPAAVTAVRPATPPPVIDAAVRDALLTVFSRKGSYVQELLVEEAAAAVDALSVSALGALLMALAGVTPVPAVSSSSSPQPSLASALGSGSMLNVMQAMTQAVEVQGTGTTAGTRPVPGQLSLLPASWWLRLQPLVQLTEEDREALAVVQGIIQLYLRMAAGKPVAEPPAPAAPRSAAATLRQLRAVVQELGPLVPQMAPGLALTVRQFLAALLARAQLRWNRAVQGVIGPAAPSAFDESATETLYATELVDGTERVGGEVGTISVTRALSQTGRAGARAQGTRGSGRLQGAAGSGGAQGTGGSGTTDTAAGARLRAGTSGTAAGSRSRTTNVTTRSPTTSTTTNTSTRSRTPAQQPTPLVVRRATTPGGPSTMLPKPAPTAAEVGRRPTTTGPSTMQPVPAPAVAEPGVEGAQQRVADVPWSWDRLLGGGARIGATAASQRMGS